MCMILFYSPYHPNPSSHFAVCHAMPPLRLGRLKTRCKPRTTALAQDKRKKKRRKLQVLSFGLSWLLVIILATRENTKYKDFKLKAKSSARRCVGDVRRDRIASSAKQKWRQCFWAYCLSCIQNSGGVGGGGNLCSLLLLFTQELAWRFSILQ